MDYFYTSQQRNARLSTLTENQRLFLIEKLKRGKRTVFSNALALGKGTYLGSDQDLEQEIQLWEFIDLLDGGEGNRPYRCECGMSLRYQYIVKNIRSGAIKKFGRNHFEFHTGIPANIVKDIIKGFESIDYELDEILYKLENGWDRSLIKKIIDYKLEIPIEIYEQLQLRLPLLDKQMNRLAELVREKEEELHIQKYIKELEKLKEEQRKRNLSVSKSVTKPVVNEIPRSRPKKLAKKPLITTPLGSIAHQLIIQSLENNGTISVLELCEELNTIEHNYKGYFSTGKPLIYPHVAMFLDQLVKQGLCRLEKGELDDRWYSVV
ncbi:DUF3895 domain-containing protein [Bacillus tuaregi]|uniref:DUF3895 domain-containing protein n=1 Tax=Bacillus tuaregi TaxID=1816695 RepID=UPI0008F87BC0|nr:DUF3895 domain-containing protein [Bacillus tuaregi]